MSLMPEISTVSGTDDHQSGPRRENVPVRALQNNRQVVVTLEDSGITKLSDLEGKTVVLQNGSTASEALDGRSDIKSKIKGGKPIEVDNNVLAMYELRNRTSDAVVMDEIVARYYIAHLTELEDVASEIEDGETDN